MNQNNWVGVDTHKNTIACYKQGKFKEFPTTKNGFKKALQWAENAKWAIEGAYCFGKPFAAYLIQNGCEVYEVNTLLTKTWRKIYAISNAKTDFGDAKVISLFADNAKLQKVSLETVELKEKLTARKLAVKQKTEITNSIKMLFNTRGIELSFKDLTTKKALKWLLNQDDIIVKNYANVLNALMTTIYEIEKEIEASLPEKAQKLTKLKGVKSITAASIYTETKGKLISSKSLASYAGVAPVENSSGKSRKHRNNKTGNRNLNSVFYQLSLTQSLWDEKGKSYYEKKLSEGKTKRHARKCLARQLINIVFKILND
jgi:transposase